MHIVVCIYIYTVYAQHMQIGKTSCMFLLCYYFLAYCYEHGRLFVNKLANNQTFASAHSPEVGPCVFLKA